MIAGVFNVPNPRAVRWLKDRSAFMYQKTYGAMLEKQIGQTAWEHVRSVVTRGAKQGWSGGKIAAAITERYKEFLVGVPQQHIDNLAHLIAVTESGNAFCESNMIVALDLARAGIEMEKSWLGAGDGRDCQLCSANAAQGWIPLNREFQSGHQRPLGHPACRCDLLTRAKGAA